MMTARMFQMERIARGLLGVGMLAYYGFHPSAVWALLGVVPLVTALMNFCPLYAVLRRRPAAAAGPGRGAQPAAMSSAGLLAESTSAAMEGEGETPAARYDTGSGAGRKRKTYKRQTRTAAGSKSPAQASEGAMVHVTDATFAAQVLQAQQPVLVDFWAEWCGPCRAVAPTLEALARQYAGRARIVKVNVDRCPRTAKEFGIRSIPTLALFQDGEVADVLVGLQSKEKLARVLDRAVRSSGAHVS
jgi:thioredoxin 1